MQKSLRKIALNFFNQILFTCALVGAPAAVVAQSCTEYFTSVWGNPLDMNSSDDILTAFPPNDRNQVTDYSFSGGVFSLRTTGNDPWFKVLQRAIPGSIADETTKYGDARPVNTSAFKQLRIRMNVATPSALQVIWEKPNGTLGDSGLIPTTPGFRTYTINLDVSNWSTGEVHSLRIDPTTVSGEQVQIDFIHLVAAGCDSPETRVVTFKQPDREGGEDFFSTVKNNPANFNSTADIAASNGNSSAQIFPSNTYQDSSGATRQNDYLEGINTAGDGDPTVHLLFPGKGVRVDATRFKIVCWTLDVLNPITEFHSVVRILWNVDGNNFGTDDFVTKFNGEARYCSRLDTVPLEPPLSSGATHPWRNNSDGQGLDFFRFDPHEEGTPTRYRLGDMRLAADHEADKKFAIVVEGERGSEVELQYRAGQGSFVPLATLPANRNTDTHLWNTSSLAPGVYRIRSKVGLTVLEAPGVIVIDHSGRASDATAPVAQVDVPINGHTFDGSLQVAGFAVDNRRVASVEVTIDGILLDTLSPSLFDARARDGNPTLPYGSDAGFNRFFDTTGITPGAHTVTVTVYDTAGNTTVYTASVNKVPGATPAGFVPPFSEGAPVSVPNGINNETPVGSAPKRPRLNVRVSGASLTFSASANGTCPTLRLLASATSAGLTTSHAVLATTTGTTLKGRAAGLSKLRRQKSSARVHFGADCGGGTPLITRSVDPTRLASRRTVKSIAAALKQVVDRFKQV